MVQSRGQATTNVEKLANFCVRVPPTVINIMTKITFLMDDRDKLLTGLKLSATLFISNNCLPENKTVQKNL